MEGEADRGEWLVAVASTASSPSTAVSSKHGGGGYRIVGGPNGNAVAPATKSTIVETTVKRLLRNRKEVQVRQMRREVAQLLEANQDMTARIRVEHVIREEKFMQAYDLIEVYCELIVARLSIIDSQNLFVSNASADVRSEYKRALSGSSLFGMFALKTGTGKANTIEGEMRQKVSELLQDTVGVIPRAVHHIFEILAARKADYSIEGNSQSGFQIVGFEVVPCSVRHDPESMSKLKMYDKICVWCWHHIIDMAEKEETKGRCPACRTRYDKDMIVKMAATCDRYLSAGSTLVSMGKF
ncbi:Kinesin-like protein KIN-5B [Zea mays]|uniref:Kinesin-like protein KIN-5B n=1 Tax=Zea mays TaxID=4577 RepID=A0A317YJ15_MAIZE|nr:Kinesin-like protein KIN-5B [Zea mays]